MSYITFTAKGPSEYTTVPFADACRFQHPSKTKNSINKKQYKRTRHHVRKVMDKAERDARII